MLLYEIEEAFGSFVREKIQGIDQIPEKILKSIESRTSCLNKRNNPEIEEVLEATYLDEVFQLAQVATKNTSLNHVLISIKSLAVLYGFYEIRNSISHPNRPFIDCYWYKLAAFASEPLIQILGLMRIQNCLESAENGTINDPPEDWFDREIFEIRNNLPLKFDHDITGLIGREKESQNLLKLLENPRVNTIGIIAPGGLGKTAIVLDLLHQQVKIPKTTNYADAVIFVSMKIESLTASGIESISAARTIEELKLEIIRSAQDTYEVPFENFEECKEYLDDQKVLICIDNLETLLRDDPEAFDELNLQLPVNWRVLVTSRTLINANQIIRLDPLEAKPSAHLVRSYIRKKGLQNIESNTVLKIAEECYFNPLAIRLTLDRIIAGNDIPKSICASKSDIAEFSFRNLIESLTDNSVKILEALFLCGPSSRPYLCDLLDLTLDETSEAISQLLRTSLLSRKIGEEVEKIELSLSVKDLLLTNQKSVEIRAEILDRKNKISARAKEVDKRQKELSISEFHQNYIPQGTNQNLKILLEEFHRCSFRDIGKQVTLIKKFESHKETYSDVAIFHRNISRLLSTLKDFKSAIVHAKQSIKVDEKDPLNRFNLADCYFRGKNFEKSAEAYITLADQGWTVVNKSNKKFAISICHGLFQSLLHVGAYGDIIKRTEDWEAHPDFKGLLGGYRATAFKRLVENSLDDDHAKYAFNMLQAIKVLDSVFTIEGYTKSPCILSWKIFEEIEYSSSRREYVEDKEYMQKCLNFVADHLSAVLEQTPDKASLAKRIILTLKKISFDDNPVSSDQWTMFISDQKTGGIGLGEAEEAGLIIVKVYHVPRTPSNNFIFAKDDSGVQYYLHKDYASEDTYESWNNIFTGMTLAIAPGARIEGKAIPALDIKLIKNV